MLAFQEKYIFASFLIFGLALICSMQPISAIAQTVIVVRHGEKLDSSADPVLSTEGEARAARLANMLSVSKVSAIYTTQFKRTMLLAAPTAKRLGLIPVIVPAKDMAVLLAKILAHAKGDVVLVVGHSNTVPQILKGLGHKTEVTVKEEDFDDLFVVAIQQTGAPTLVHLKY